MAITPSGLPVLEKLVARDILLRLQKKQLENPDKEPLRTIRKEWMGQLAKENSMFAKCLAYNLAAYEDSEFSTDETLKLVDCMVIFYHLLSTQGKRLMPPMNLPYITAEFLDVIDPRFPKDQK